MGYNRVEGWSANFQLSEFRKRDDSFIVRVAGVFGLTFDSSAVDSIPCIPIGYPREVLTPIRCTYRVNSKRGRSYGIPAEPHMYC